MVWRGALRVRLRSARVRAACWAPRTDRLFRRRRGRHPWEWVPRTHVHLCETPSPLQPDSRAGTETSWFSAGGGSGTSASTADDGSRQNLLRWWAPVCRRAPRPRPGAPLVQVCWAFSSHITQHPTSRLVQHAGPPLGVALRTWLSRLNLCCLDNVCITSLGTPRDALTRARATFTRDLSTSGPYWRVRTSTQRHRPRERIREHHIVSGASHQVAVSRGRSFT